MPRVPRALLLWATVILAAIPFAFGLIRAVRTGHDVRYVWLALAGACGAFAISAIAREYHDSWVRVLVFCASFLTSAVLAVCAGLALGTRLGPGLIVVAAGFAGCFSFASLLNILARQSR